MKDPKKIKDIIGFSGPEEGPLSDFNTYAPDMMELFALGIAENEELVVEQARTTFGAMAEGVSDVISTLEAEISLMLTESLNEFAETGMEMLHTSDSVLGSLERKIDDSWGRVSDNTYFHWENVRFAVEENLDKTARETSVQMDELFYVMYTSWSDVESMTQDMWKETTTDVQYALKDMNENVRTQMGALVSLLLEKFKSVESACTKMISTLSTASNNGINIYNKLTETLAKSATSISKSTRTAVAKASTRVKVFPELFFSFGATSRIVP